MASESGQRPAAGASRRRVELELGSPVHWLVHLAVNAGLVISAGGSAGSWWRLARWGVGPSVDTLDGASAAGQLQQRLVWRGLTRERAR
jgi:hypothetical protein